MLIDVSLMVEFLGDGCNHLPEMIVKPPARS
jgi:hypothetical protein